MLDAILAAKRAEVAARRVAPSQGPIGPAPRPPRGFERALRSGRTGYILECKRASPSSGVLRPALDVPAAVRAYDAYADAISVLTDRTYFSGSLEDLRTAAATTELPLLCKDFILTPFQVDEARAHGADAVLLILAALDDAAYADCAARAARAGMDVLTEVHDEVELRRAVALGARIIGINNRDLRTLTVDLGTTTRLAPLVPADRLVVAESGVATHQDARRLRAHADALLVGSALMRSPDLSAAARELIYGVNKICGLTRPDDAAAAERAGATHGGLVFAPGSPRRITPERARTVRDAAHLRWVGVFADQPGAEVAETADRLRLWAVQLHGAEDQAYVAELRPLLPAGCEVWKGTRVEGAPPPLAATGADRLVLDSRPAAGRRGMGPTLDWQALSRYPDLSRCLLAGGLTPGNAAAAADVGAYGLDVSAGVEERAGAKSVSLVTAFLAARRGGGRPAELPS
jgi:indole-3-glycerol phosphate synthase/phosphoribosylanthranilate isomerase